MHQVHTESHLEIHNNTEGNSSFHASTEPAAIVVDWPSPCGRLTETIAAPLFWCPFPGLLQPCGTYHSDLWPLDSFTKEQCSVYRNMITFIEGLLISSPQSECFQSSSVTNYPLQMPRHQQWLDWHGSGWWYSLCRGVDHPQILPAWKKNGCANYMLLPTNHKTKCKYAGIFTSFLGGLRLWNLTVGVHTCCSLTAEWAVHWHSWWWDTELHSRGTGM